MAIENENSLDGITNFILNAIANSLSKINTANMATITAISEDKKLIDVTIDTTKEEVPDVPFITIGGGGNYLRFPIAVGDKCLMIFAKDTVEDWMGGGADLVFSSNFDINNGFALVGIHNSQTELPIQAYTELKVDSKLKISNSSDELITLVSDTTQALSDAIQLLSDVADKLGTQQVVITSGSSQGSYPLDAAVVYPPLKADIDALKGVNDGIKAKIDGFKV